MNSKSLEKYDMETINKLKSFLKIASPDYHAKFQCNLIKEKCNKIDLPLLEEAKYKQFKRLFKESNKQDNYTMALMFFQLKNIFIEIYSHDKTNVDIINILFYLSQYDEYYFKLIRRYMTRKEIMQDYELSIATRELEMEIKCFIYRFKFLLKNEDDVMDLLNKI